MCMTWSDQKIKEGFERFFKEYGRYPTAREIDKFPFLPSSRSIQRIRGGLKEVRRKLGLSIVNYTEGAVRSAKAKSVGTRGLTHEKQIRQILLNKFGEIFVHEQKPFNDYEGRLDFYVYSKNENFGIDVFYPSDQDNFTGCINNKQRLYKNVAHKLILLQANPQITQKDIYQYLATKKNPLPSNILVFSLDTFLNFINSLEPLKVL